MCLVEIHMRGDFFVSVCKTELSFLAYNNNERVVYFAMKVSNPERTTCYFAIKNCILFASTKHAFRFLLPDDAPMTIQISNLYGDE